MIFKKVSLHDCIVEKRCFITYEGGLDPTDQGVWCLHTCGNQNGLHTVDNQNASGIISTTNIDGRTTDWIAVYPDESGQPHKEINDYLDRTPTGSGGDPVSHFFNKTAGKNYLAALHYDTHPREPLQTTNSTENSSLREHTAHWSVKQAINESPYDHFYLTVFRPLVISSSTPQTDNRDGIWDTVFWPFTRKVALDRRAEGELTGRDYYVQLYEVIAYDSTQSPPSRPAIAEATGNSTPNHNFDWEFVSVDSTLKKLRREQTDIRQSRIRRLLPKYDGKKRARAVSEDELRQFTTEILD